MLSLPQSHLALLQQGNSIQLHVSNARTVLASQSWAMLTCKTQPGYPQPRVVQGLMQGNTERKLSCSICFGTVAAAVERALDLLKPSAFTVRDIQRTHTTLCTICLKVLMLALVWEVPRV